MSYTSSIKVNSPYELLLVGVSNYISKRLELPQDERDFQYLDEKQIEAFKYQEVIYELAYYGFIKYQFSKDFKLKSSTVIRALKEMKGEKILENFYVKAKGGFYIHEDDLRESDSFRLFRQGVGFDFSLVVLVVTLALLDYKYKMEVPLTFIGDRVEDYFRDASTLHYYKILGYVKYNCDLSEKVLNSLNSNIFKSIGVINGYLGNELVSYYDKLDMLGKQGIRKGSVVYLYKRNQEQLTSMNDIVEDCTLAIVEDFGDFGIKLRKLPIRTSYEYIIYTYNNYSDDVKELYGGLEYFFPYSSMDSLVNLTWTSCGVSYVQNSKSTQMEDYFITNLKMVYNVELPLMQEDGRLQDVVFTAPEAVLFLLLQYKIDFDKDLYLQEYKNVDYDRIVRLALHSLELIEDSLGYKLDKKVGK